MEFLKSYEMIYISLLTLGAIGVFDEIYFHQMKGRLVYRKECYVENVLHLIRSFCFSFIFLIFSFVQFQGVFVFLPILLFLTDLIVGVLDIIVEKKSRSFQNGLSSYEYLIHMILSFHLGVLYINLVPYLDKMYRMEDMLLFQVPDSNGQE